MGRQKTMAQVSDGAAKDAAVGPALALGRRPETDTALGPGRHDDGGQKAPASLLPAISAVTRARSMRTVQRVFGNTRAKRLARESGRAAVDRASSVQRAVSDEEDKDQLETSAVGQAKPASGPADTVPTRPEASRNKTGMPERLKSGLENLSGMDLSGVRVHYNSGKPAQLNALAYTQGQDIHVAPGQERHLPHEGWHAVQQAQGRVKPTMQAKGVAINDDAGLEREADVMGTKSLAHRMTSRNDEVVRRSSNVSSISSPIQMMTIADANDLIRKRFGIRSAKTNKDMSGAGFALMPSDNPVELATATEHEGILSTSRFYQLIKSTCKWILDYPGAEDNYLIIFKAPNLGMGGGYEGTLGKYNNVTGGEILIWTPLKGYTVDALFSFVVENLPDIRLLTPDEQKEEKKGEETEKKGKEKINVESKKEESDDDEFSLA